eukprot:gene2573-2973_t
MTQLTAHQASTSHQLQSTWLLLPLTTEQKDLVNSLASAMLSIHLKMIFSPHKLDFILLTYNSMKYMTILMPTTINMASPSSHNRAKRSRQLSGICDAEHSSEDDLFASQTRFRTPDVQQHEVHDNIDALLQGEQLESTTPTKRNLTPAQKNLIKDLAKHKVTILKHQGMANHFKHLSQSGTIFPDYTQPALQLRDYKIFSSDSKSRLNTITKTFQRSVLELLSAHHDEVAANTKLLVDSRNDSITSMEIAMITFTPAKVLFVEFASDAMNILKFFDHIVIRQFQFGLRAVTRCFHGHFTCATIGHGQCSSIVSSRWTQPGDYFLTTEM